MKRIAILGALLLAAAAAGCGGSDGGSVGNGTGTTSSTPGTSTLSSAEAESLTFTREEEKLARDVYLALQGHEAVFTNISSSEQSHMDAVLTLLTRYGLPDPAEGNAQGQFTNAALQKLHDELVAKGSASVIAAMQVGVTIEELDLRDIEQARAAITRTDILTTYDNLTRGSRNHLRSFYSRLTALGGTYTPQYLDPAAFQAIVDSPMETGGPAR